MQACLSVEASSIKMISNAGYGPVCANLGRSFFKLCPLHFLHRRLRSQEKPGVAYVGLLIGSVFPEKEKVEI